MITALESAIAANNAEGVQEAIFDLGRAHMGRPAIDDEVAFAVVDILKRPEMWSSSLSGHILNFFQFEAPHLSQRAKDHCTAFLREWGNQFTDIHSMQVVDELRMGSYLASEPPKMPRKKPRHAPK